MANAWVCDSDATCVMLAEKLAAAKPGQVITLQKYEMDLLASGRVTQITVPDGNSEVS